jgi:hypothetical protein
MKIMAAHRAQYYKTGPIETYARSMVYTLRKLGHEVIEVPKARLKTDNAYKSVDLLLDIDSGRDESGQLVWHAQNERVPCKSAVYFIDSHGYPSMHKRISKHYDHIFFSVWDKRDLFAKHPSAHWSPNFTDLRWFNGADYPLTSFNYDFGFFGSKGGLDRADKMKLIATDNKWTYSVREVMRGGKHRWPRTANAMAACQFLFNKGQKHDGPNLRVMESMAMNRPLINDRDDRSGMDKLFEEGKHYLGYDYFTFEDLEEKMRWCIDHPSKARKMALAAYYEVRSNHLVGNRISQILEIVQ